MSDNNYTSILYIRVKKCLKNIILIWGVCLLITPFYAISKETEKYDSSTLEAKWPKEWIPLQKIVLSRVN